MKKVRSALSLVLALALMLSLNVTSAFAATSTKASVPVTLTVSNQYRAVNVTVPSSLPVQMIDGELIVARNAKITNNAKRGAVCVSSISVTDGALRVGDYYNFKGSETIALQINGCGTKGPGPVMVNRVAFPTIAGGENLPLSYQAKVATEEQELRNVTAAQVIFTISIV